jgi:transcriptional regulator with XRE-family HTH domain
MPLAPENTHKSRAREALRKHIAKAWESQAAFARASGVPEKAVAWYLRGRSVPSLRHAAAIEKTSKGMVRCVEWMEE